MSKTFGDYDLLEKLGRGAMGVVWKAYERGLERPVALKVMLPHLRDEERLRRRFLIEARSAAGLSHENIVRVHRFEVVDEMPYIAMEFVDGSDLKHWLGEHGTLPFEVALIVVRDMCRALAHAHGQDRPVVHRDVKPSNIMLGRDGLVRLMDFGLARLDMDEGGTDATATGMVLGTWAYMSPEQSRGERVGVATDVFSAGVVAYELFGGRRPFEGATPTAVAMAIQTTTPPALDSLAAGVPADVAETVKRMIEKDPSARPRATEVLTFFEHAVAATGLVDRATVRDFVRDPSAMAESLGARRVHRLPAPGHVATPPMLGSGQPLASGAGDSGLPVTPEQDSSPVHRRLRRAVITGAIALAALSGTIFLAGRGRLELEVVPPEATVELDGRRLAGPLDPGLATLAPGPHVLRVSAAGFEPAERAIDVRRFASTNVRVALEAHAAIQVRVTPLPVEARLDGRSFTVRAETTITGLHAGAHTLELTRTGHQPLREQFTLDPGAIRFFDAELARAPAGSIVAHDSAPGSGVPMAQTSTTPTTPQGTLRIRVTPSGKVFLDGQFHGTADSRGVDLTLPEGTYDVRVEGPEGNYELWPNVRVRADDTHLIEWDAATLGTVAVMTTNGMWARILVDGRDSGVGAPNRLLLPPGRHRIGVVHEACRVVEGPQEVQVKPGVRIEVRFTLRCGER